jgi:hypothetical protein
MRFCRYGEPARQVPTWKPGVGEQPEPADLRPHPDFRDVHAVDHKAHHVAAYRHGISGALDRRRTAPADPAKKDLAVELMTAYLNPGWAGQNDPVRPHRS